MGYFVGGYWGQRAESRLACAKRISMFLQALAEQDTALSLWFKKANSQRKALKLGQQPLPNDAAKLAPLLSTSKDDIKGETIVDLGFRFSAWTGKDAIFDASLEVKCGAFSPGIRNALVLNFPGASVPLVLLKEIMKCAVTAFNPEDAIVTSTERISAYSPMPVWEAPAMFRYRAGSGFLIDP